MTTASKIMKGLIVALGIVVVGLALYRGTSGRISRPSGSPQNFGTVADFKLTDHRGKSFGSKDLQGHPWVANFIFTRCQGPCPVIAAKTAQLQTEFAAPNLRFVSFSVDPEHDQPAILAKYANVYGAGDRWSFVTGAKKDVYDLIRGSFKLAVESNPGDDIGDAFIHSMHFVLIDAAGRIKGYYNSGEPAEMGRLRADLPKVISAS